MPGSARCDGTGMAYTCTYSTRMSRSAFVYNSHPNKTDIIVLRKYQPTYSWCKPNRKKCSDR